MNETTAKRKTKRDPSRSPHRACIFESDIGGILRQAYMDDAETNRGYMFGSDAVRFFTDNLKYPERWSVVGRDPSGGYCLLRSTDRPDGVDVVWVYHPSSRYDPSSPYTKATFVPLRRITNENRGGPR